MRHLALLLAACLCAPWCFGAQAADCAQGVPCPTALERKQARKNFERGVSLSQKNRDREALAAFEEAARLAPADAEYLTAREITRQKLVLAHLERGNEYLLASKPVEALNEFRGAVALDPQNTFAQQRLADAAGERLAQLPPGLRRVAESREIELRPQLGRRDFNFRGDARQLLESVAAAWGVTVKLDSSVSTRNVRFRVEKVDFRTAMDLAGQVTKTFWSPTAEREVLIAADSTENRRLYERMSQRTFYFPETSTPQELNDLVGLLRSVFEMRLVTPVPQQSAITVRAPKRILDSATRILEQLFSGRPQVMLDVKVYEVNRSMLRNLGVSLPLQFTLFNITTEALQATGSQSIQDLIDQLIASGGLNQVDSGAIAALLSQLQNQQSSLLSQPIATFGGGSTLMGLTIPPAGATFSLNESKLTRLQHVLLRASENNPATLHIGSRFPILNATFSPIFNSPDLTRVVGNNTFRTPFPSFTYEDLGLKMKATPLVRGEEAVALQLELQVRALSGQTLNSVPVVSNREFSASMELRNGESAVMAGTVSSSEQRTMRGLPGISRIPVLGRLTSTEQKEEVDNELLVVVTPYILKARESRPATEMWPR